MKKFQGKTALVTGAARGMGKAIATAFAMQGARVAVVDTNARAAQEVVDEIVQAQGEALCLTCDASDATQVRQTVSSVLDTWGSIDILVNNAGILQATRPLEDIAEAEWDSVLNVNLKGVFLFCRYVLPVMRGQQSGKVVNMASSAGRSVSELGGAHYTASKAGVIGLTRHSASEYAQYGININSVCPGLVETPMIREEASQQKLDHWLAQIPLGRFSRPEEAADLVLFLASPEASYITGATIDFNGGSLLI